MGMIELNTGIKIPTKNAKAKEATVGIGENPLFNCS
jgi:hypothetical protein